MKEPIVGEIVETLIRIKDTKGLSFNETEAVNAACNLLYKSFDRETTQFDVPESTLAHVKPIRDIVKNSLRAAGFAGTEENIEKVTKAWPIGNGTTSEFQERLSSAIEHTVEGLISILAALNRLEKAEY